MGSQALRVIIWVNLAWTPQRELGKHQRYGDLAFNNYGFTPNKTNWGELPSMAHEKWWLFKHQTWEDSPTDTGIESTSRVIQYTWLYYLFQCWWRTNPNPIRDENSDLVSKKWDPSKTMDFAMQVVSQDKALGWLHLGRLDGSRDSWKMEVKTGKIFDVT